MEALSQIGKISPEIFDRFILPRLGAKDGAVLVGPKSGVDCGIVEIGDFALSLTTDPVFIVPEYGWQRAAWFAIHIIASDSVTSGLKPRFLSIDLNLPMSITDEQFKIVWDTIHHECLKLGIAIATGHTGRYENCAYPMVGGATLIGVGGKHQYVAPSFVRPGDDIIITKGPAIEATGILATMFPELIEREFGKEFSRKASDIFCKMSVVEDALTAVSLGVRDDGVTAMHDATEYGIWGGVYEMARAAGLGVRIHKEKIVVAECVPEICSYFGIDPYSSISEGTLIIACRKHKSQAVVAELNSRHISCSIVGEFTTPEQGPVLVENGREVPLQHPGVDPFWKAFYQALERKAS